MKTEENSIQDDIRAAMKASEENAAAAEEEELPAGEEEEASAPEGEEPPAPKAEEEEPRSDRDEQGRPNVRRQTIDPNEVIEGAETGRWTTEKAPSSWKPAAREQWNSLPQPVREEIIRREEAAMMGVRSLQERHQPVENFVRGLEPVFAEARAVGAPPERYIMALAQSERILRTADVPTKFQEILRIAQQYGVPLAEVINKSVGEEIVKSPARPQQQLPPEVAQELSAMRQWREEMERTQATTIVESFGASEGKEFFNDVRGVMADLIDMGQATTLDEAYDKAVWMVPEVREVMLARQSEASRRSQQTSRQAAAASASLPASGSVAVDDFDEEDDIAATVRKAMSASQTGRV